MPPRPEPASPAPPGAGASLSQWLTYLEALHPAEIDLGLDRVLLVLRRLFPAAPGARIITVAGTNGKGSTVACIESLLLACGRRVGAYTSPHLERYNERIRINGRDLDDAAIVGALEAVEAVRDTVSMTYFEFGTLAAFYLMAEAGVEDWVLEVGLGGRLDAVNCLDADLAIITTVDLDHTAWLGSDRETIGYEKAGILRPGRPAIFGETDLPHSIAQQAHAQNVPLYRSGEHFSVTADAAGQCWWHSGEKSVPITSGALPQSSVAMALQAMTLLQPQADLVTLAGALPSLEVPGRFETLGHAPRVIADVGHNPQAARWLAGRLHDLKTAEPERRIIAVYACLADKDAIGVVKALQPVVDGWVLAGLDSPRGLTARALEEVLRTAGLEMPGFCGGLCRETVTEAASEALTYLARQDVLVVFGSFHTVAEVRRLFAGP